MVPAKLGACGASLRPGLRPARLRRMGEVFERVEKRGPDGRVESKIQASNLEANHLKKGLFLLKIYFLLRIYHITLKFTKVSNYLKTLLKS